MKFNINLLDETITVKNLITSRKSFEIIIGLLYTKIICVEHHFYISKEL